MGCEKQLIGLDSHFWVERCCVRALQSLIDKDAVDDFSEKLYARATMLSSSDKKWIANFFEEKFNEKFDEKFDEKFGQALAIIRNDLAQFKDDILSQLVPLRDDHDVLVGQVSILRDQVDLHKGRLDILERKGAKGPKTS